LKNGATLQQLARAEIGGTPTSDPKAYAARSPISYVHQLATNGVPLDIWWSRKDKIVVDQYLESGRLYRSCPVVSMEPTNFFARLLGKPRTLACTRYTLRPD
jgi:hypothetical protein